MGKSLLGSLEGVRRPELADLMLLATVTLWALNFTVTKYVLSHGFQPIAYACLRFGAAAAILSAVAYGRERSFEMRRRDLISLAGAALIGIFLNQLTFVYAIKLTTATTVALLFGTLPVLAGLFALVLGIDRVGPRFWVAGVLAAFGAALVALGSGGALSAHLWGDLLALAATATWAWYSVAASPLLRRYSPLRVSSIAFVIGSIPLFVVGAPQLARQDFSFGPGIWLLYVFAVVGPLFAANLLWFGAISRVGPSRASVFANLQPFLAAVFSLLILGESMTGVQIAGGVAIAGAIVLSRDRLAPARVRPATQGAGK
jgi:drug/metabolite transporter (DMT)-like permease